MAEVRVKLIADAMEFMQDSEHAVDKVESMTPVLAIDADTTAFRDAAQQAVDEVQKLRPTIQIAGGTVGGGAGAAGAVAGGMGAGTAANNQSTAQKQLMTLLRQAQTQNQKLATDLQKAIEDLSHSIEKGGRGGSGGSGGRGGSGRNQNNNDGLSWKQALLNFMNIKPSGENGTITGTDVLGGMGGASGQRGGLMEMMGGLPGIGILSKFMTGMGIVNMVAQSAMKQAQQNKESRDYATGIMQDTYDVMGSVYAFSPAAMAAGSGSEQYNEEGYSTGAYALMEAGQDYGYDFNESLNVVDTMMNKSGFTNTQDLYTDAANVMAAARATGVSTDTMATLAGTATQYGYQENGDQSKILSTLGREIEVSGMQGREDEMVDVLQSILEELGAVNSNISEEAVGDKLNLINALSANDPNLNGARAKNAIDSIEDFTSSSDMSVMIAAGYGSEFTGKKGWMKLRQMQEEDPTAFMERVITGFKERGMNETDVAFMLDQKGIGSANMNAAVIDAIYKGVPVTGDMTDTGENRVQGRDYIERSNEQYSQTVAPYTQQKISEGMGKYVTGAEEDLAYKGWDREMADAGANRLKDETWHRNNNMLGDWGYGLGKFSRRNGVDPVQQLNEMDAAVKDMRAGEYDVSGTGSSGNTGVARRQAIATNRASAWEGVPKPGDVPSMDTVAGEQNIMLAGTELRGVSQADMAYMPDQRDTGTKVGLSGIRGQAKRADAQKIVGTTEGLYGTETYAKNAGPSPEPSLAVPFTNDFGAKVQDNAAYMSDRLGRLFSPRLDAKQGRTALGITGLAAGPLGYAAVLPAMLGKAFGGEQDAERTTDAEELVNTEPAFGEEFRFPVPFTDTYWDDLKNDHTYFANQREARRQEMQGVWDNLWGIERDENGNAEGGLFDWFVNASPRGGDTAAVPDGADTQDEQAGGAWENRPMGRVAGAFRNTWSNSPLGKWIASFRDGNTGEDAVPAALAAADAEPGTVTGAETLMSEASAAAGSGATDPTMQMIEALGLNTEELKKNTLALGGEDEGGYVTGSQRQAALTGNAQGDALSNSVSIESPLSRFQQEHPFLYGIAQGVSSFAQGVSDTFGAVGEWIGDTASAVVDGVSEWAGDVGDAFNEGVKVITGQSDAQPQRNKQTVSSSDGGATTVQNVDGSQSVTGDISEVPPTPHAIGNDYIPYDGYRATLHRGEMILPKDEADTLRQGRIPRLGYDDDTYADNPLTAMVHAAQWSQGMLEDHPGLTTLAGAPGALQSEAEPKEETFTQGGRLTSLVQAVRDVKDKSGENPLTNAVRAAAILRDTGQPSAIPEDAEQPSADGGPLTELTKAAKWSREGGEKPDLAALVQTTGEIRPNTVRAAEETFTQGGRVTALADAARAVKEHDASAENPLTALVKAAPVAQTQPDGSFLAPFSTDQIGTLLDEPAKPAGAENQTMEFRGGDINININVTGKIEGVDEHAQRQIVESIQAQIAGAGLRDLVANGFTRRQNW